MSFSSSTSTSSSCSSSSSRPPSRPSSRSLRRSNSSLLTSIDDPLVPLPPRDPPVIIPRPRTTYTSTLAAYVHTTNARGSLLSGTRPSSSSSSSSPSSAAFATSTAAAAGISARLLHQLSAPSSAQSLIYRSVGGPRLIPLPMMNDSSLPPSSTAVVPSNPSTEPTNVHEPSLPGNPCTVPNPEVCSATATAPEKDAIKAINDSHFSSSSSSSSSSIFPSVYNLPSLPTGIPRSSQEHSTHLPLLSAWMAPLFSADVRYGHTNRTDKVSQGMFTSLNVNDFLTMVRVRYHQYHIYRTEVLRHIAYHCPRTALLQTRLNNHTDNLFVKLIQRTEEEVYRYTQNRHRLSTKLDDLTLQIRTILNDRTTLQTLNEQLTNEVQALKGKLRKAEQYQTYLQSENDQLTYRYRELSTYLVNDSAPSSRRSRESSGSDGGDGGKEKEEENGTNDSPYSFTNVTSTAAAVLFPSVHSSRSHLYPIFNDMEYLVEVLHEIEKERAYQLTLLNEQEQYVATNPYLASVMIANENIDNHSTSFAPSSLPSSSSCSSSSSPFSSSSYLHNPNASPLSTVSVGTQVNENDFPSSPSSRPAGGNHHYPTPSSFLSSSPRTLSHPLPPRPSSIVSPFLIPFEFRILMNIRSYNPAAIRTLSLPLLKRLWYQFLYDKGLYDHQNLFIQGFRFSLAQYMYTYYDHKYGLPQLSNTRLLEFFESVRSFIGTKETTRSKVIPTVTGNPTASSSSSSSSSLYPTLAYPPLYRANVPTSSTSLIHMIDLFVGTVRCRKDGRPLLSTAIFNFLVLIMDDLRLENHITRDQILGTNGSTTIDELEGNFRIPKETGIEIFRYRFQNLVSSSSTLAQLITILMQLPSSRRTVRTNGTGSSTEKEKEEEKEPVEENTLDLETYLRFILTTYLAEQIHWEERLRTVFDRFCGKEMAYGPVSLRYQDYVTYQNLTTNTKKMHPHPLETDDTFRAPDDDGTAEGATMKAQRSSSSSPVFIMETMDGIEDRLDLAILPLDTLPGQTNGTYTVPTQIGASVGIARKQGQATPSVTNSRGGNKVIDMLVPFPSLTVSASISNALEYSIENKHRRERERRNSSYTYASSLPSSSSFAATPENRTETLSSSGGPDRPRSNEKSATAATTGSTNNRTSTRGQHRSSLRDIVNTVLRHPVTPSSSASASTSSSLPFTHLPDQSLRFTTDHDTYAPVYRPEDTFMNDTEYYTDNRYVRKPDVSIGTDNFSPSSASDLRYSYHQWLRTYYTDNVDNPYDSLPSPVPSSLMTVDVLQAVLEALTVPSYERSEVGTEPLSSSSSSSSSNEPGSTVTNDTPTTSGRRRRNSGTGNLLSSKWTKLTSTLHRRHSTGSTPEANRTKQSLPSVSFVPDTTPSSPRHSSTSSSLAVNFPGYETIRTVIKTMNTATYLLKEKDRSLGSITLEAVYELCQEYEPRLSKEQITKMYEHARWKLEEMIHSLRLNGWDYYDATNERVKPRGTKPSAVSSSSSSPGPSSYWYNTRTGEVLWSDNKLYPPIERYTLTSIDFITFTDMCLRHNILRYPKVTKSFTPSPVFRGISFRTVHDHQQRDQRLQAILTIQRWWKLFYEQRYHGRTIGTVLSTKSSSRVIPSIHMYPRRKEELYVNLVNPGVELSATVTPSMMQKDADGTPMQSLISPSSLTTVRNPSSFSPSIGRRQRIGKNTDEDSQGRLNRNAVLLSSSSASASSSFESHASIPVLTPSEETLWPHPTTRQEEKEHAALYPSFTGNASSSSSVGSLGTASFVNGISSDSTLSVGKSPEEIIETLRKNIDDAIASTAGSVPLLSPLFTKKK